MHHDSALGFDVHHHPQHLALALALTLAVDPVLGHALDLNLDLDLDLELDLDLDHGQLALPLPSNDPLHPLQLSVLVCTQLLYAQAVLSSPLDFDFDLDLDLDLGFDLVLDLDTIAMPVLYLDSELVRRPRPLSAPVCTPMPCTQASPFHLELELELDSDLELNIDLDESMHP